MWRADPHFQMGFKWVYSPLPIPRRKRHQSSNASTFGGCRGGMLHWLTSLPQSVDLWKSYGKNQPKQELHEISWNCQWNPQKNWDLTHQNGEQTFKNWELKFMNRRCNQQKKLHGQEKNGKCGLNGLNIKLLKQQKTNKIWICKQPTNENFSNKKGPV